MNGIQQVKLNEQLFIAVLSNNIEEAERLINAGASVYSVDKHGRTPLHHAAQRGYVDLAAVVLKVNRKIDVAVNKYLKFVWAYLFTAMLLLYRNSFRAILLSKQSTVSY